jgi:CHAT domain-containing protein/tetratricopeptide (TPR) repeat protein
LKGRELAARDVVLAALVLAGILACQKRMPPAGGADVASPAAGRGAQRRFLGAARDRDDVLLAAGEFHEYSLGSLAAGDAVHVVLEQNGVDLLAQVIGDDGRVLSRFDSPIGAYGPEHVCFVAHQPGTYRLFVMPLPAGAAGRYGMRLRQRVQRSSSSRVADCAGALRALGEAEGRRAEASGGVALLYQRAVELARRAGEPFLLAVVLKQAGSFSSLRGDVTGALRSYDDSLLLLRGLSGEAAGRQLASVLNLSGLARDLAAEPERARASFTEARAVAGRLGDRVGEASAISNLALWETSGGDPYRAIELHREALAIWRRLGASSHEATTLNLLGVALTELGRYGDALDVLSDALRIRQRDGRPEPLANTWMAIGWAEHLAGRGAQAVGHFSRAIDLYRRAGARLGEAGALDRLGSAYRDLGRQVDARHAFETSLRVYRASGDRAHAAHTASNLGCLLGDPGLLDEAAETFTALGDRAALAQVRFCQARRELDAGRLDAALRRIAAATGLVDELRGAAQRRGNLAPTLALWQKYSQLHVEILMRLQAQNPRAGYDARAFEVSDLERARRLHELLSQARVEIHPGVPDQLLARERAIQRRLNAAELRRQSLLQQGGKAADVAALEKTLRGTLSELSGVQSEIRASNPHFAELRRPSPVRLREAQALLAPDTLLLSYVLGDDRSFLFVVSRNGIDSHVLPARREIDELAWRVYEGLRNSRERRTWQQLPALAGSLSDLLLGPVRAQLAGRRLLVVGDGMLHYVPFAALPLPGLGARTADGGRGGLVIDRFEVVHLPSAAVLKVLRQRARKRRPPPKQLAVVADAVYSTRDERLPPAARARPPREGLEPLLDLPYTRHEAEAILAMVAPGKRLAALGFAASPELIREGGLHDYRMIHFATHGLLNEEHPELSGIALSMFDEHGRPRDGNLRLHEIYDLDLPADLVVLSACRTALTEPAQGAGLVGLTHGFFYAGASRLVVSLWDVHDEATAELMTVFYRGLLRQGLSPAAALRAAQLRLRGEERWRAAYYWAAFVLEGDWR